MIDRGIHGKRAVLVAQMVKNLPAVQETWVQSLDWEDPLEEGMATTPVFLPGESHEQRSLAGYSPLGRQESDTTKQLSMHTWRHAYMETRIHGDMHTWRHAYMETRIHGAPVDHRTL